MQLGALTCSLKPRIRTTSSVCPRRLTRFGFFFCQPVFLALPRLEILFSTAASGFEGRSRHSQGRRVFRPHLLLDPLHSHPIPLAGTCRSDLMPLLLFQNDSS